MSYSYLFVVKMELNLSFVFTLLPTDYSMHEEYQTQASKRAASNIRPIIFKIKCCGQITPSVQNQSSQEYWRVIILNYHALLPYLSSTILSVIWGRDNNEVGGERGKIKKSRRFAWKIYWLWAPGFEAILLTTIPLLVEGNNIVGQQTFKTLPD